MTGFRRVFIDGEKDFYSFSAGTNVALIVLNAFDYMETHAGTVSGLQTISIQGVDMEEVAFASIDTAGYAGKYAVSGVTNCITIAADKTTITSAALAKNYITGMLMVYQMYDMEYVSTDPTYTMESYAADGTLLGTTRNTSVTSLTAKMEALDEELNVNDPPGYYSHVYTRGMTKSI
jgi:hypothetical protein